MAGDMVEGDMRAALYTGAAFTQLTRTELDDVLSHYDLGRVLNSSELKGGLANSNYAVKLACRSPRMVLVKVCDEKTVAEIQVQLECLEVMKKHKFPTAYPYSLAAQHQASAPHVQLLLWRHRAVRH